MEKPRNQQSVTDSYVFHLVLIEAIEVKVRVTFSPQFPVINHLAIHRHPLKKEQLSTFRLSLSKLTQT